MWSRDGSVSLRRRLVVALAAGIAATLTVAGFAVHLTIRAELLSSVREHLEKRIEALAEYAIGNPGRESATESMLMFRGGEEHEHYFEIRDAAGRVLARSSPDRGLGGAPSRALYDGGLESVSLPDGHPGLAIARVVPLPPTDPRGGLAITVGEESAALEALERDVHRLLATIGLVTVAATILVASFTVTRGLAPLARLAAAAEKIDPDGERRELQAGPLPRELATLATKLSDVLRRLFDARDRERRLTRSIAHELRTPLAELRMLAEVGALASSLDASRRSLRDVGEVSAQMHRIVDALFALARYESGQEQLQTEPVELCALVRHQVALQHAATGARDVKLAAELPPERWVLADAMLLERLLGNLIGNAVSHSPSRSRIVVTLDANTLRVENPAPHLGSEDVARFGERFFRPASDGEQLHAGLGLAIARAIAIVSGLRLTFEIRPGGALVAQVAGFRVLDPEAAAARQNDTPSVSPAPHSGDPSPKPARA